jgi:membrane dipeptidase
MLLAYNVRNLVADGCAEPADAGLSNFGRQVVREMDRVGIIVDGTHTGRRSSLEAI